MVAFMRAILSVSGLLVVTLIPTGTEHFDSPQSLALVAYAIYSLVVWVIELKGMVLFRPLQEWGHWIDVGFYTSLIILNRGTVSIFFWYFFPILVASFRWGFWSGIRVVVVSTVLVSTVAYISAPPGGELEQQRFLIRPIYFLTVGYMMSYWGGSEVRLRRRMVLLQEVAAISNPRFGVDRTLGVIMHRLLLFFGADGCAIVTTDPLTGAASLRRASRARAGEPAPATPIPTGVADLLLSAPGSRAVVYSAASDGGWRSRGAVLRAYGPFGGAADAGAPRTARAKSGGATGLAALMSGNGEGHAGTSDGPAGRDLRRDSLRKSLEESGDTIDAVSCESIANALEAGSFLSVPLSFRQRLTGRIYLTVASRKVYDQSDARFLQQAVDQVLPLVDNIRLVNQLATAAAEEERQKIARDIHDSVIQPYVGLQIGLAGLREKLAANGSEMCGDMERLMEMTNQGIADLRRQVSRMKEKGESEGSLLPAVWRFATRFSEATGIAVQVEAEADIQVEDRLAAEAFQMVAEGLSNVRRHTRASHATVALACRDGSLHLRIENDGGDEPPPPRFTPRSLTERAAALGGAAHVATRENGATVVSIEVPL